MGTRVCECVGVCDGGLEMDNKATRGQLQMVPSALKRPKHATWLGRRLGWDGHGNPSEGETRKEWGVGWGGGGEGHPDRGTASARDLRRFGGTERRQWKLVE